jgi:hypothetical protein
MSETTVASLAKVIGIPVETLLEQFRNAGIKNLNRQSIARYEEKLVLLKSLKLINSSAVSEIVEKTKKANQLQNSNQSNSRIVKQKKYFHSSMSPNEIRNKDKEFRRYFLKSKTEVCIARKNEAANSIVSDIETHVAGVSFTNTDGSSRQSILRGVKPGECLNLVPENNNPHHINAYKVVSPMGQIGYLKREISDSISIKGRNQYKAKVLSVGLNSTGFLGCKIRFAFINPQASN